MKKRFPYKLRQGVYSTAVCLLAAVLCIALAVTCDHLESKHGWQLDFSFNSITTQSAETRNVLKNLTRDVHIYAVFSDGAEDVQLTSLLDRYQAESQHITWSQENLSRNPLLLGIVSDYVGDAGVSTDCLIIQCAATDRTRVLTGDDYIAYGYNAATGAYEITGWTYEKSLTEAILYVTMEELPKVQILTGHGELNDSHTAVMEAYLVSANYEITRVNLNLGDVLDPAYPLMILSPVKDITDDELSALLSFAQSGGALFITVDYTDPDTLPNFHALYRMYGFEVLSGVVIASSEDTASYLESPANILPTMHATDMSEVLLAGGADFVVLSGARALEIPASVDSSIALSVVLSAPESAYLRTLPQDGSAVSIEKQEGDRTGPFALALTATRIFDGGDASRAFIIGNSSMFLDEWMYAYTYSGELLLQAMQHLQGRAPVDLDIIARQAVREPLSYESIAAPVVLLTLTPMIVAVLAVAVLRPRKHL